MLSFEGASLGDETFSTSRLSQNILAVVASNLSLGMTKDNGDFAASTAFDIHKVGIGSGD